MSETSLRLGLPFLMAGQAQKELTHNEALAQIDAYVAPAVLAMNAETPPAVPIEGQAWILGGNPTGIWAGQAFKLAVYSTGGWRFLAPLPGILVWVASDQFHARWTGSEWSGGVFPVSGLTVQGQPMLVARRPAIADATGGVQIDAEARAALNAILAALRAHGLIEN